MTKFDLRGEDCVTGMSQLTNESVDLVVTSPPYNLGIDYRKYADRQDRQSYLDWCATWSTQIRRILRSMGSFFLNIGSAPSNPMLPHQIVIELTSASGGFVLQNTLHWIKSIAIDTATEKTKPSDPHLNPSPGRGEPDAERQLRIEATAKTFGHFKPINSKRFLNDCHEYIFHFTKIGHVELDRLALGVPYQDKSNIARWRHTRGSDRRCRGNTWFIPYETIQDKSNIARWRHTRGSDRRCRGNTWFIPYETIQSREKERPHPATFPIQLAEWCIKLHGVSRIKTMLDPFLGLGNSAVAAQRCGVKRFIGFEIDETYIAEAKRRLRSTKPRSAATMR